MSENREILPSRRIAANAWWIAAVLLYAVLLGFVLDTIGFGTEDSVRQFITRASSQTSAEPIPPIPVIRSPRWPDVTLHRDPFQPLTREAAPAVQQR